MVKQTDDKPAADSTERRSLLGDESGTTTLEWALLLGAIALPAVYVFTMAVSILVDYYRMMTTINGFPIP